jgi:nucleoside phosphorylase
MSLQEILRSISDVQLFTPQSRRYFMGELGDNVGIVVSQVPPIGNIGAAFITTALILDNDVSHVFVVGLCGGLKGDRQALADVVVSSDVIYYEPGLIGTSGTVQRVRISGTTPPSILRLVEEMSQANRLSSTEDFAIHIGSIASGEKVIRSSSDLSEILRNWSNVVAVDMEGAGVFEAAASIGEDTPIVIVRGIADFADDRKYGDNKRPVAIRNAVSVALSLIRRLPRETTILRSRQAIM